MDKLPYVFERPPDIDEVIAFMGLRASKQALCCFDVYVGFARTTAHHQLLSRAHIMESLGRYYDDDTVDRSLQRLEAHGMIAYVEQPADSIVSGSYYRACPMSAWHAYDQKIIDQRRERVDTRSRSDGVLGSNPPAPEFRDAGKKKSTSN